ncbi:ADAM 17-like protease [Mya arenaria]|uniref:ADAM 17-like protease n=1 Tax=Mya arenaria TaxID=6604 RepID=UPI0022DF72AF|nr:ADAM 17-like protease [Mya arenaria]
MDYKYLLSIVFVIVIPGYGLANIHKKLRYFETLKADDFTKRVRRSTDVIPSAHLTEIHVSTLGKKFHLVLKQSDILSPKFRATVVGANGKKTDFNVNEENIFSGTLADDRSAVANLNFEDSGAILANIVTADDTYVIEPSYRHLPDSENHTMIAYRRSDVKFEDADQGLHRHTSCGIKEGIDDELHGKVGVQDDEVHSRKVRHSPYLAERKTCQIIVVADYTFFSAVGGSLEKNTALYMINMIQFVNTIYRKTQFDVQNEMMTGVGFEIGEMRIHGVPTPANEKLQGRDHYNVETDYWNTKELLEAFSFDKYFKKYCLAHLFTSRRFDDGVLGLAYIASDRMTAVGGICSKLYPKYPGVSMTLNTGWSSSLNSAGHRILALQALLITAHEFGHNLGSEHDPETDNCAPSDYKDGKYLMYPWAVMGYDKNNQFLSPCSREYIFKVIKVKGYDCFIEGRGDGAFCGNGRLDEKEECDAGYDTIKDIDPCCDSDCQLRDGKVCSPMNYDCCTAECKPASSSKICRPELNEMCSGEIKCNGDNITCPNIINNKPDGTPCIDQGTCKDGMCLNYCENFAYDLTPCICAEQESACHRCCKPKYREGKCENINQALLPDGRPCYQGMCEQGVCMKQKNDMVQRLFSIIENITVDQFVAFMRSNIVGTVMVMSLLLWIPTSCIIRYQDKKLIEKERALRIWKNKSNRTLVDDDTFRIRRVHAPSVRNSHVPRWPREDMEGPNRLAQPPGGIGREPRQVNIEHLMSSPRKPIEIQMNSDEDFGFGDRKTDLDFPLDVPGPHAEFRFPAKPDPELLKHRSDFDTDSDAGFRQTSSDWDKETIV